MRLFLALFLNIFIIIFYKNNSWKLTSRSLQIYDSLHDAEILYYDPKLAAEKIKKLENMM